MVTVDAPTAVTVPLRGSPGGVPMPVPVPGAGAVLDDVPVEAADDVPVVADEAPVAEVEGVAALAERLAPRMPPPARPLSSSATASPLRGRRRPGSSLGLVVFIGSSSVRASPMW